MITTGNQKKIIEQDKKWSKDNQGKIIHSRQQFIEWLQKSYNDENS